MLEWTALTYLCVTILALMISVKAVHEFGDSLTREVERCGIVSSGFEEPELLA